LGRKTPYVCSAQCLQCGGILDDRDDVQTRPSLGADLEEIAGEQRLGLAAQEVSPGGALSFGRGRDAVLLEDLPDGGGGDCDTERRELAVDSAVAPHEAFSRARRKTRARIERIVGGRPRRFGLQVAAWRNRSRCQRRSVSGRTSSRRCRSLSIGT
jgi:hypothetical protein